jgi:hypothetical protein
MKLNWGTGIFIFIVVFMGACVAFFIFARHQDNSLVENDYYAKSLRYEEVLQKMRNTAELHELPLISMDKSALKIQFPSDLRGNHVQGTVNLYRPSDKNLDRTIPLIFDSGMIQQIPASMFKKGKYIVKLDWAMSNRSYYFEKEIFAE